MTDISLQHWLQPHLYNFFKAKNCTCILTHRDFCEIIVTFLHHVPNSLGQLSQYGGPNSGFGITFTPGVPLRSQYNVLICRFTYRQQSILDVWWRQNNPSVDGQREDKNVPGSMNPLMTPNTLWISLLTSTLFTSTVMFSLPPSL